MMHVCMKQHHDCHMLDMTVHSECDRWLSYLREHEYVWHVPAIYKWQLHWLFIPRAYFSSIGLILVLHSSKKLSLCLLRFQVDTMIPLCKNVFMARHAAPELVMQGLNSMLKFITRCSNLSRKAWTSRTRFQLVVRRSKSSLEDQNRRAGLKLVAQGSNSSRGQELVARAGIRLAALNLNHSFL